MINLINKKQRFSLYSWNFHVELRENGSKFGYFGIKYLQYKVSNKIFLNSSTMNTLYLGLNVHFRYSSILAETRSESRSLSSKTSFCNPPTPNYLPICLQVVVNYYSNYLPISVNLLQRLQQVGCKNFSNKIKNHVFISMSLIQNPYSVLKISLKIFQRTATNKNYHEFFIFSSKMEEIRGWTFVDKELR